MGFSDGALEQLRKLLERRSTTVHEVLSQVFVDELTRLATEGDITVDFSSVAAVFEETGRRDLWEALEPLIEEASATLQ